MKKEFKLSVKKLEIGFSVALAAFCIFFLSLTLKFPAGLESNDLGPAAFPQMVLGVVLFLDIIYFFQTLKKPNDKILEVRNFSMVLLILVVFGVYVFLTGFLGYMLATALFIAAMLFIMKPKSKLWGVVFWAVLLVVIYFGFYKLVGIPLPKGQLFPKLF